MLYIPLFKHINTIHYPIISEVYRVYTSLLSITLSLARSTGYIPHYSITYSNTWVRREHSDCIFDLSTPPSVNASLFNNQAKFMLITWMARSTHPYLTDAWYNTYHVRFMLITQLARCQLVHQLNCKSKTNLPYMLVSVYHCLQPCQVHVDHMIVQMPVNLSMDY